MFKAIYLLLALSSFVALANTPLGTVTHVEGKVKIHQDGSPRGQRVKTPPATINLGQFVRTFANSSARVKLYDDSKILVTENATLEFTDNRNLTVEQGRILFSINKRDAIHSLNILTKTAVIGVKGTQFLVEANGDEALLYLKEGEVEVKSLAQEFEDFKAEYEQFKKDYLKEFAEFKKSMSVKAGVTISIGKQGLREISTPAEIEVLFKELDEF